MRKLLVILVIFSFSLLFAAEFVVKDFQERPMDVELARNPVPDVNGEYAALIKISTDLQPFTFETNIGVVDTRSEVGEFWAYVPGGTSQLIFTKSGFNRYRYRVPITIKKNTVYSMILSSKGYGMAAADENLVQLIFNLNQAGVFISLDNSAPIQQQENVAVYKVPSGQHTFTFSKTGYDDVTKTIDAQEDETMEIALQPGETSAGLKLPGFIDITSQPTGAEIFVNNQKLGVTPATIQLTAGQHTLKLMKNLYHSYNGSFSLQEGETKTLETFQLKPKFGYYRVSSNPSNAQVFLDDKPVGKTPIKKKVIASGNHNLRISFDLYHDYIEDFVIKDGDYQEFDIELKPAYGTLVVNSEPVDGAEVYLDDKLVGTTPFRQDKLASGQYNLKIDKELWMGTEDIISILDEQTTEKTMLLTRNFATLNVTSPNSNIYVNNKLVGNGSYKEKLAKGEYTVLATRDKHHDAKETVHIIPGQDVDINLEPKPMLASLSVQSKPYESKGAEIWLNGSKQKKTTPAVMELLIGDYDVTLKHPDFLDNTKQVSLEENQQKKLVFQMETYEGSMLAKANKWRTHKWVAFTSAVLLAGAGVYSNYQGDDYFDKYEAATTTQAAISNRDNMQTWYDRRDMSYYVSIGPAAWFLYSWIKEAVYMNKVKE